MQWEHHTASNAPSSTVARMSEIDPTRSGAAEASMSMRTSVHADGSNAGWAGRAAEPDPAFSTRLLRPGFIGCPFASPVASPVARPVAESCRPEIVTPLGDLGKS